MLSPEIVILGLKIAVGSVTVLLAASLIALAAGNPRLHGRINTVFFALVATTVIAFEIIIRVILPDMTAGFTAEQRDALSIHLCFSIPSAVLVPVMLYTGKRQLKTAHRCLAVVFLALWIGTAVTGIFFLPHTFDTP